MSQSNTPQWLKHWAESYPDIAQDLVNELQRKPNGGFSLFIKRSRLDQEDHLLTALPTMSVEPQTKPLEQHDTSEQSNRS